MSVIAKATNSEFKREFLLRGQSRTESSSTGISEMVVQQPEIKQGKAIQLQNLDTVIQSDATKLGG